MSSTEGLSVDGTRIVGTDKATDPHYRPAIGDLSFEADGVLKMYNGIRWVEVTTAAAGSPGVPVSPVTPRPIGFDPHDVGDSREPDPDNTELLEVLLCPHCDYELGSAACDPTHAYLADNPWEHRLLKPLLDQYLSLARARGELR